MPVTNRDASYAYFYGTSFCCLHGYVWLKEMGMQSMHANMMGNKLCLTRSNIVCLTNDGHLCMDLEVLHGDILSIHTSQLIGKPYGNQ